MLRTALTPRWLGLLAAVLVIASGMAWLGSWQLERARDQGAEAVSQRQEADPVPLLQVLQARQTFPGRLVDAPVVAAGRWDGARQLLVAGQRLDGVEGWWVLTPLVLEDGSAVAVVRGWVGSVTDPAAAPPTGAGAAGSDVEVRGILAPGQPPVARDPGEADAYPAGQIGAVAPADLVQRWPYPLLTGYIVATAVEPALTPSPRLVPTVEETGGGLALRNLSYAVQWWLFAAFGLFLWWRLVRDDHRGELFASPGARTTDEVGEDGTDPATVSGARP